MRLATARIKPLSEAEWTDEQRQSLEPRYNKSFYNAIGTVARHWDASKKFDAWTSHVMGRTNTLSRRHREMLILRIGWLCQSEYEWGQHALFAREVGMRDDEIEAVKRGAMDPLWSELDAALLRSVDELHEDAFISDPTWDVLKKHLDTQQLMDVVFTVGGYNMVSMILNTFGVQLDAGVKGF